MTDRLESRDCSHTKLRDGSCAWCADAYALGFSEADGAIGMTYDGDPESDRSRAYDRGRTDGEAAGIAGRTLAQAATEHAQRPQSGQNVDTRA